MKFLKILELLEEDIFKPANKKDIKARKKEYNKKAMQKYIDDKKEFEQKFGPVKKNDILEIEDTINDKKQITKWAVIDIDNTNEYEESELPEGQVHGMDLIVISLIKDNGEIDEWTETPLTYNNLLNGYFNPGLNFRLGKIIRVIRKQ